MKLSKYAVAAVLGLGLTTGFASTSMASLSDYAGLMPKDELARAVKRAEQTTGVRLAEVTVWSRENASAYSRFWKAFRYNYEECVIERGCSESWVAFGDGSDASDSAGDGDGGSDGGGGTGAAGGVN